MVLQLTKENHNLPEYTNELRIDNQLTDNALYVFTKKYLQRDGSGKITETPTERTFTIAKTMAEVEKKFGKADKEIEKLTQEFYEMITEGRFSPAGRIWSNAGTEIKGLFNCYVLPVEDDLYEIYESVRKAAIIHKNGGGTGYNFSELRPRGTYVTKSRGIASGPVSFIKQFDRETEIINSGNRRGANMGILDISHPDILDFIYAKTERGEITNFNVSVGITEKFMKAVESKDFYDLEFPRGVPFNYEKLKDIIANVEDNKLGGAEVGQLPKPASLKIESENEIVLGKTKIIDSFSGKVTGRINEQGLVQLNAMAVFDIMAELAWKTADPGVVFLDEVNKNNPLPELGDIRATNPCGEQPLHAHDACNLGSVNLAIMVREKFGKQNVDYEKIEKTVKTAVRFMDNVNDANKGPIHEIEQTVLNNRRIGLGVMGFADMIAKLGVAYDSEEGRALAEEVMGFITETAKKTSHELSIEKGVFPRFEKSSCNTGKEEDKVRNVQRTTIAPTGTISMIYDVASGIEPFFALTYKKNIRGGDSLLYTNKIFVDICEKNGVDIAKVAPLIEQNHGSCQGINEIPKEIQKVFKTAHDIATSDHIKMQAAFQRKTDNAVSKTINLPENATVEDVKNAYLEAYWEKLKGTTVYRDGCKQIQVLETGHKEKSHKSRKEQRTLLNEMIAHELNRPRPKNVIGRTEKVPTPFGHNIFVTVNWEKNENGEKYPYECFASIGKASGDLPGLAEAIGRLTSICLKAGVPGDEIIKQLQGIGGETQAGFGKDKIKSLPDAIAKGIKDSMRKEIIKDFGEKTEKKSSGNVCPSCLTALIHEEGCEKCFSCGYSRC